MLLAFIVALLQGGSFRKLANAEIKNLWLAFVIFVIVTVLFIARRQGFEKQVLYLSQWVHIFGIIPWALLFWFNRRISGSLLVIFGLVLNLLPIAANNGKMPVSIDRMKTANISPELIKRKSSGKLQYHCVMSENTKLNWLADWIPVPAPPFYIQPNVLSPGDVFCTVGMFFFIRSAMGVPRRKPKNETVS